MKTQPLAFAAVIAVLAPSATALGQAEEPFRWTGTIAPGGSIEIRGLNGDIEASPASGSTVEITAVEGERKSGTRQVKIEVVEDERGVLVCALHPARDPDRPNRCTRGGNSSGTRDNDVRVDFRVRVPTGTRFVARTVNGAIRASGLSGDVEAVTVNGEITLATAGTATARTVNGSIEATTGRSSWAGPLRFQTVNGSITVVMPGNTRAEVVGKTVNGGLESDFPLELQANRSWGPRRFEGRIGGGGSGTIEVETVNGSIHLRRKA